MRAPAIEVANVSDRPPITDDELAAMESRARLVGSANCWTGTGGSVAADSFRLIAEVRRLRTERAETTSAAKESP